MTIQQRLRSDKDGMAIAKISLKFKNLMNKGNGNGALKLWTGNIIMLFCNLLKKHLNY